MVGTMATVVHVVDDNESFRNSIARLLRVVGYEVVLYKSAQLFLERLPDDGRAGCILLDVLMPGLSGPQLQSRLTELGFTLPIVFLTGSTEAVEAEDFLIKPVPKDKLIDSIERAVRRHRALQEQISQAADGHLVRAA
jgi:FixJ family two-component response regulator